MHWPFANQWEFEAWWDALAWWIKGGICCPIAAVGIITILVMSSRRTGTIGPGQ